MVKVRRRTYKLRELFVADTAVGSLEALRVEDTALCVDVAETDGCQDFHRCRFLKTLFQDINIMQLNTDTLH